MADPAPQSPLWWLNKLSAQLQSRQTQMGLMDRYYSGDHPLPFLTQSHQAKIRSEFRLLLEDSQHNFMRLVVDAIEERLHVEGFRLSAENDPVADKDSWAIWQANQMDAESQTAFVEALVKGVSYLSVWEAPEGSDYPLIAVEDPSQTIVGYVPGSGFRQRAAALKVWIDDWTGLTRANVYLPDGIYKFQRREDTSGNPAGSTPEQPQWEELENEFVMNRVGVVPIIPLRNRPRLLWEGESELSDIFHIQSNINSFLFLLAIAGYFGAHRQRWAAGVALMEDENGRPIEPFDSAVDRLWVVEDGEVKFGEFSQTDLTGYLKAIEQKVDHIGVISRIPRHYLEQTGQSPSGDAIESAEAGLVKLAEKKQRPFGEGLEEALRLARRFKGADDAPVDSEIVWGDAANESEAVRTDAVIKQYSGGLIPWEAALERLGFSQTEIQRFSAMRLSDALLQGIANPTPPAPAQVTGPDIQA